MVAPFVGLQTTHKLRGTELPQMCCGTEDSWLTRRTTSWPLQLLGRQHKRNLANNIGDGGRGVKSPIGIKNFKSSAKNLFLDIINIGGTFHPFLTTPSYADSRPLRTQAARVRC